MSIFEGAGVALVTPMKANGEVNYEKLEEITEFQIKGGTDAIIVCGTTGEASTLTHEEHLECISVVAACTKKRIPVIAGTGSNCTQTAVYLSQEAEKRGADGLLVVSPYYNKATQKGLKQHFTTIAKSVGIPVILYNIKGRTGVNIANGTMAELAKEVDNIVAVKEANGDISQVAELMHLTQGDLDVYSGNDDQIVPILSLGGKGVISVLSNIEPQKTHEIVASYLANDVVKSRKLQIAYIPLINALFSEVNPIPVKKAMNLMGLDVGPLRLPLTEMDEAKAGILAQEMKKVGITLAQ
ncbi:MAG: 4-hydroxy-tetrahydrodipicolinate synthase [Lachnospiraceae bacterium]|nr:4-hydroxy-tetrahydrodipicolinate synthase [Lachnospiraceae bacterium]